MDPPDMIYPVDQHGSDGFLIARSIWGEIDHSAFSTLKSLEFYSCILSNAPHKMISRIFLLLMG